MRTQATRNRRQPSLQRGATVVEFAGRADLFTLLIGIMGLRASSSTGIRQARQHASAPASPSSAIGAPGTSSPR